MHSSPHRRVGIKEKPVPSLGGEQRRRAQASRIHRGDQVTGRLSPKKTTQQKGRQGMLGRPQGVGGSSRGGLGKEGNDKGGEVK